MRTRTRPAGSLSAILPCLIRLAVLRWSSADTVFSGSGYGVPIMDEGAEGTGLRRDWGAFSAARGDKKGRLKGFQTAFGLQGGLYRAEAVEFGGHGVVDFLQQPVE